MKKHNVDDILKRLYSRELHEFLEEIPSLQCHSKIDGNTVSGKWKCKFINVDIENEEEIHLSNEAGIYFIFDKDKKVYYIGESTNLYTRLSSHYHTGKIIRQEYKKDKNFEQYTKEFRRDFLVKVIILNKEYLNSLKYELRTIEQFSYIALPEHLLHEKLMSWDNKLFNENNSRINYMK